MKESFRTLAMDMQIIYSKNILVLFCRKLQIFKRDVKLADNTLDKQAAVLTDLTAPQLSLEIRLKNMGVLERLSTFYIICTGVK